MTKLQYFLAIIGTFLCIALIGSVIFFGCTPAGVRMWNGYQHSLQSADDDTNYETRKKVEDTCRSMIASYNADKLAYQQYCNSESPEKQSWAEQAKMRANRTASDYNNFILKNNYVWKNDVPSDIFGSLPYIE